ncbi:Protein arginine N-methyltransferase skb1 [Fusarium oxysporum f. sp. albedinis]|nr:Protein arginine N-methyltransferase skb1 [Fusarium oxysporum f. sp. albedinis]
MPLRLSKPTPPPAEVGERGRVSAAYCALLGTAIYPIVLQKLNCNSDNTNHELGEGSASPLRKKYQAFCKPHQLAGVGSKHDPFSSVFFWGRDFWSRLKSSNSLNFLCGSMVPVSL